MVAGRPVSVQSPASSDCPFCRRPGRFASCAAGRERGAPLAHDLPRRQYIRQSGDARYFAPDRFRQFFARRVDQPVAGADGDGDATRKRKDPFRRGIDDAEDRRQTGGWLDAEMRVDDGAEFRRHLQPAHQRSRDIGGTARLTASSAASSTVSPPNSSAAIPFARQTAGPQTDARAADRATLLSVRQRRLDHGRAQPLARDQRPARLAAGASVSRITAPASRAVPSGASILSAARNTAPPAARQRALAGDHPPTVLPADAHKSRASGR